MGRHRGRRAAAERAQSRNGAVCWCRYCVEGGVRPRVKLIVDSRDGALGHLGGQEQQAGISVIRPGQERRGNLIFKVRAPWLQQDETDGR